VDGNGDPEHPILGAPSSWWLREFTYHSDPDDFAGSYVDLVFARGGAARRLRFAEPSELSVGHGLPHSAGLRILDVRGRGLEGIGVLVTGSEDSHGVLRFWAREVAEIPPGDPDAEPGAAPDRRGM
jgi:hypothetical protein